MTSTWIHPGGRAVGSRARLGGKAANLIELASFGQPVPSFYVVTADAFEHALRAHGLATRIRERLTTAKDGDAAAADVRAWIAELALPPEIERAITDAHKGAGLDAELVAVRSSALDEDSGGQSFAGMHDSFLFVRGRDALLAAVKRVWASAYNDRALAYRRTQGLRADAIAVAVVVQRMVDATRSGVLFTLNPATSNVHEVVVSALYGAGEGLVSAGLDADTFTVTKRSRATSETLAEKSERLVRAPEGGLRREIVPDALRNAPCLSAEEIAVVVDAGLAIERHFGRPQDVEFCFDAAGALHIVQARPVTRVDEYGPAAGHRLVWDNSNIIESYSGVTSPMTFSFIERAYTIVYHCFADVMGISPAVVRANERTFSNMLGLIRGRVYYNLANWYRLVRLFPGFEYNARFMESMMGLKEPLDIEGDARAQRPTHFRRWFVELPKLLRLVVRSARNFRRIQKLTDEFQANFRAHYDRWDALDFDRLQPHELMALYHEMEDALLWNWKAPIINDFYVMIHYGVLKKLCASWANDTTGSLQNDLICGEGGVESAEPAKMLLRLAQVAQRDAALRELILTAPLVELPELVAQEGRFAAFDAEVRRYLDLYGFRCMNELKLEELSLRDRPHLVYQVLRNYLALNDPAAIDVDAMEAREQAVRREAEQRAFGAVSRGFHLVPRKTIFRWALNCARRGVKNRENMRFARTRIYGLLRELLRALGKRLAAEELLDDREDVFYLTIDEVWDFVKGTAVCTDLRGLARVRRAEFDRYRADDAPVPDDRFETYGMASHKNAFKNPQASAPLPTDGKLHGTGCCPGEITGPVKVIRTPNDATTLAKDILVAERTDPGWVPLYPMVSGILIERGSILSHSAVVAREMGIPTIVGIAHLMKTLKDGERVRMDGTKGTVEVVSRDSN